jgi:benzoyl-CoA 2,3-dioxygenase component B
MSINYSERIPNNVDLATDRALQRALEHWQPKFLDWWQEMGPSDFAQADVYCARRSASTRRAGRATGGQDAGLSVGHFPRRPGRRSHHRLRRSPREPVWQQVPGEFRSQFRRIIVTQGDTEPASVEQQHLLGRTVRRCTTCATCSR